MERLFKVVDPVNVGAAKRASELSADIGERLLLMHMTSDDDRSRARQIAENLNRSFFAHGDAVSRSRAKELQLKIAKEDKKLEGFLWQAYSGLESLMQLRKPFLPLHDYLADPSAAASLEPAAPVRLPVDTPAQIAQQVWTAVANQAIQNASQPVRQVPYSLIAVSLRKCSNCLRSSNRRKALGIYTAYWRD